MSFLHNGRVFAPGHRWSRGQLLAITPEKIMRYLLRKIYGDENANPDEDPPVHHRRNAVLYWKKAWSYFMLDQNHQWSEVTKKGNPTRAAVINKLLRAMKKMEAARRGKPSMARRSFIPKEFEKIVTLAENHEDPEVGACLPSYMTFQLHMIARLDDTAKFRLPDLKGFRQYPDLGCTAKLCWAKNCMEERDAPTQVLFGARNWRYCTLQHLGMWLELHYELNPDDDNEFIFGLKGKSDPDEIKDSVAYYLRLLLKSEEFTLDPADLVDDDRDTGSHSTRKLAVNLSRGNGRNKDETDHRGRWKGSDRQQDQYADTTIPYVDAIVAAALCVGGPIAYFVRDDSGVSSEWILEHVTPHMLAANIPRQVCIVLGRALLWKVWEAAHGDDDHRVPASIKARVMAAMRDLGARNRLEAGTNPVRRANLGVSGLDAQLYVFELMGSGSGDDDEGGVNSAGAVGRGSRTVAREHEAELRFLGSEVQRLQRAVADSAEQTARRDTIMRHILLKINRNLARLAAAPGRRMAVEPAAVSDSVAAQVSRPPAVLTASLMPRPRTLHDLWAEWQHGGGGRKPAKDFNSGERGAVRSVYSFRKPLWDKVAEMVRAGDTANVACDKIYAAYGEGLSVTAILRKMRADRKNGTWPDRLVVYRL